jgi:hypothetical protein
VGLSDSYVLKTSKEVKLALLFKVILGGIYEDLDSQRPRGLYLRIGPRLCRRERRQLRPCAQRRLRSENFDSYYFSAYDKISGGGYPNDDADWHFGLCRESGLTKDVRLMKCK